MRLIFVNSGIFLTKSKSVSKDRICRILCSRISTRVVQSVSVGMMLGCFRIYDFAVANVGSSILRISIFSLPCMRLSSCRMMFASRVLAHATVKHSLRM